MIGPRRLRLTVVLSYGLVGGAETWLLDLLDATSRLDVDAVLLGSGPAERELAARGIPFRVLRAGRRPADLPVPVVRLAGLLRRSRPDLVLGNGVKAGLVAGAAGRLAGVRAVWVKHDHSFDGRISTLASALGDAVVATSPSLAAAAGGALVVPPPRHPAPQLDRNRARQALGLDPDEHLPVLGMIGRLVPYKGCEDAVRALREPAARSWQLVLVGDPDPSTPDERRRLSGLAEQLGVSARVRFTGSVARARELFAAFDAVAVLTRDAGAGPDREGFGITALEAMTAGIPVVAVSTTPLADRLLGAGIVVAPGRPVEVAAALAELTDPAHRARLGAFGAAVAARHPDAAGCADELVAHLAEVARRPGAGLVGHRPVSVVVTVRDELAAVDGMLDALRAQLRVPGDEIIVVDGGSRDGTDARVADHARRDSRIRLLSRPGAGISAGRNAGIAAATNGLIACTDAGCAPAPGWLEALRAAAEERNPADLFTGVYRVSRTGPLQTAAAAVGYPDPAELRHPGPLVRAYGRVLGRAFDATMPTGRSLAFTRSAWQRAGGFPEHLQTGEDVLFGRAVAQDGRAVLVADAEVEWAQRTSLAATARMYFRYGVGSGRSRDRRLLTRDLARAGAYAALPVLLRGRGGAAVAALAGAAYLSLPVARVLRGPDAVRVLPAVPLLAALRDLAKAAGCVHGLVEGARR